MAVANELFCNFITWSLDGLLLLKHYIIKNIFHHNSRIRFNQEREGHWKENFNMFAFGQNLFG